MVSGLKKILVYRYNNKRFQICVDDNHKFVFLEIRNTPSGKEYYDYPEFGDCFYLSQIFNNHVILAANNIIDRSKNNNQTIKTFKHKVRTAFGYITISIFVSVMLINTTGYALGTKDEQVASETKQMAQYDDCTFYTSVEQLDEVLGTSNISEDELLRVVENNNNLTEKEVPYIKKYIRQLYKRYPNLDKRSFCEALKNMQIIYKEKINDNKNIGGYADYEKQIIYIRNDLSDFSNPYCYENFCHELTHFLFPGIFYRDGHMFIKLFYQDSGFLLKTIIEGVNCIVNEEIIGIPYLKDGYIREYRFAKRLVAILGKEELIRILSEENMDYFKKALIEKSGLPEEVEKIMLYAEVSNSSLVESDNSNIDTLRQYMEAEINIFFGVQKVKLSTKPDGAAIKEYLKNRTMFVQNIGQEPDIIKMFWQKEKEYLRDYPQITNIKIKDVAMTHPIKFNYGAALGSYDTGNMSIVITDSNIGNRTVIIGDSIDDSVIEKLNIMSNGDNIYLVCNADIKDKTLSSNAIDCLTNHPISPNEKVLTTINLNDFLSSIDSWICERIENNKPFYFSYDIENHFNLEKVFSYLRQRDSLVNDEYEHNRSH